MVPAVADGWLVPLGYGQDEDKAPRHVSQPCATMTSRLETGLAMPPFLTVLRGQSGAHSVAGPLSTVSAGGIHHGLVEPSFIAELRGGGSSARPVTEPLATVCASGNHHGLVTVPAFYVKNYGAAEAAEAMAHPVSEPLGTVTAVDHHSLVVEPFLTSYYGTGGVSSVGEPVPTVTTRDRHGLVAAEARVDDCGFRMLEPDEVGRAMAFPNDYVMVGNKRQRVRQYGNAVVPSVMKMLCERVVATLA
jgi:DNA (cytosine-5)-methyltransferase 1